MPSSKRSVHVFDLADTDVWRTNAKLELPTGFVQVVRCDMDATLTLQGESYGFPAATGTIFENVRGVRMFRERDPANQAIITNGGGVLILAVYENRADVLNVAEYARSWGTRLLDDQQATAGIITRTFTPPTAQDCYYITGFNFSYSAAPTPGSPGDAFVINDAQGATPNIMYTRMTPRGAAGAGPFSHESWLPYPLIARPGAALTYTFPSGGAGITGRTSIYGGLIRF